MYRDSYTVAERLEQYEVSAKKRLLPFFHQAGVAYPPAWMGIVVIKDVKELEVWVASEDGPRVLLRRYSVLAASGVTGPKLREGDGQVPEGIYRVESLHPNSLYHLALRVNYPNSYDQQKAKEEGRSNLGGDIMIHGSSVSIGCLAMGNKAIEEIFVMAAKVWPGHIPIIISPIDFSEGWMEPAGRENVSWRPELYFNIQKALVPFR